jgi:hypothetical protein
LRFCRCNCSIAAIALSLQLLYRCNCSIAAIVLLTGGAGASALPGRAQAGGGGPGLAGAAPAEGGRACKADHTPHHPSLPPSPSLPLFPRQVEQEPQLYLGGPRLEVEGQVSLGLRLLREGLHGADVYSMVGRDPRLLFMPELERGIRELRDLWDVDEAALRASDPLMLAFAVRALSVTGLPKGI